MMLTFRFVAMTVAGVLAMTAAGCDARTPKHVATTELAAPTAVPLRPFEPLPIAAYEGVGVADMGTLSLPAARDVAYAQAYRFLSQDIVTLHVNRVTELVGTGNETWVTPVGRSVSRALLVGKKFTDELRLGSAVWVRVYMAKAEVDSLVIPSLQRIIEELAPAMREAYAKDLQGVTPIDEQLRILADFQRRQGGGTGLRRTQDILHIEFTATGGDDNFEASVYAGPSPMKVTQS